ncbi:MAG: hypothetical protein IT350_16215, partial [Deltaproteobacteria bacterium]|nr:hypothetical protein [Deltaproteobacteria bacterium]
MRTGNRRRVCAFTVIVMCALAGAAWASPCSFEEPTTYLDELFITCEAWDGNEYIGYRQGDLDTDDSNDTATHIDRDDFEIDQFEVISLGLDFSDDGDPGRTGWQAQTRRDYCTARVRFRSLIGYLGGSGPAVAEGDVFGYIATEMDDSITPSDVCNADVLDNLPPRPGVLFLPGFRNFATPAEAAKYAAMFSAQTPQGDNETMSEKVFLLMIAPPSHIAVNLMQDHNESADEHFRTPLTRHMSPNYAQLSFGSYGRDGGQEAFPNIGVLRSRIGSLKFQQEKYLTDGFLDLEEVEPALNLLFAYIYAADRALNLFDKFF